jgi:hypothetical protein
MELFLVRARKGTNGRWVKCLEHQATCGLETRRKLVRTSGKVKGKKDKNK